MGKGKGRGKGTVCCCESELCCTLIAVFLLVYGGLQIIGAFFRVTEDGEIVRATGSQTAWDFVIGSVLVGMGVLLLVGKIMRSTSLLCLWLILLLIFIIFNILLLFLILWQSKERFSTAVVNELSKISNILLCCFFEYCVYQFKSEL